MPEDKTHFEKDGTVRQDHYGMGRQPWDDVLDEDWGPEFCAGNILKYLRRSKSEEHSLKSARWYYDRLVELSRGTITPSRTVRYVEVNRQRAVGRACAVLVRLLDVLTKDEVISLRG